MPDPLRFAPFEGRRVSPPRLDPGEIHLWACRLDLAPEIVKQLASMLSAGEQQRASRYRFETHRRRYRASRGILRALLGAYIGSAPGDVEIVHGPQGQPALRDRDAGPVFNLAHSADLVLLAVQPDQRIGVDLEQLRTIAEWQRIARRSFAAREVEALEALPEAQRMTGFFDCWTRKEALIKAHGEGVFTSIGRFEVSLGPDTAPELLRIDGEQAAARGWSLHHLEPAPGYVGALASDLPQPAGLHAWTVEPDRQELPGIDPGALSGSRRWVPSGAG